jgi:hypothetical protein
MERNATEELILILDMRASRKAEGRVIDRVEKRICLGEQNNGCECDKPATRLGLCTACYTRYRNELLKKNHKDQALYRSRLIRAGRLLDNGQGRLYRIKSCFRRLA